MGVFFERAAHYRRSCSISSEQGSQQWILQAEVISLRHYGKKSLVFMVLVGFYITLGVVIFHFVEGCISVWAHERRHMDLSNKTCNDLIELKVLNISRLLLQSDDVSRFAQSGKASAYRTWTKDMGKFSNMTVDRTVASGNYNERAQALAICVNTLMHHVRLAEQQNHHFDWTCNFSTANLVKWFEFVIATIYTIGYGNIVPRTNAGKVLTIFYSLIGIPLSITMYSFVGKFFIALSRFAIKYIETRLLKRRRVNQLPLKTFILNTALFLAVLFSAAAMTAHDDLENMATLDSIYFWWVTLATIGYGDYNFEFTRYIEAHPELIIPVNLLLVLGLGMMAAVVAATVEWLTGKPTQLTVKRARALKRCATCWSAYWRRRKDSSVASDSPLLNGEFTSKEYSRRVHKTSNTHTRV